VRNEDADHDPHTLLGFVDSARFILAYSKGQDTVVVQRDWLESLVKHGEAARKELDRQSISQGDE